jgi:hypothetical protein
VLQAVRRIFEPSMIREAVEQPVAHLREHMTLLPDQRRALERDLIARDTQIAYLVEGIGTGKATEAVFAEVQNRRSGRRRWHSTWTSRNASRHCRAWTPSGSSASWPLYS